MDLPNQKAKRTCIASRVLPDGRIAELVYDKVSRRTHLAVSAGGSWSVADEIDGEGSEHWIPIPATNSLIRHDAVRLPSAPEPYGDVASLIAEIDAHISRYVVLSDWFRRLAAYYALFSWVYDAFQEVPYLRLVGDWGAGKTRALLVLGSLCYRPFFASGASTVSPIFHTLDTFRGTLVLDEADFRFSDQTTEIIKILNNGNVRGFPVFRTAITKDREFDPRAFQVFGPKIVAMRKSFADDALESRFITERMGAYTLRPEIPLNLPETHAIEAEALRNKLLQYRFDHRLSAAIDEKAIDQGLSPRLNQILVPLLSIIPDASDRAMIRDAVALQDAERRELAAETAEGVLTSTLADLVVTEGGGSVSVSDVARRFASRFDQNLDRPMSPRYIGNFLRTRLGLKTYKSNGVYVVKVDEKVLSALKARYGVSDTTLS